MVKPFKYAVLRVHKATKSPPGGQGGGEKGGEGGRENGVQTFLKKNSDAETERQDRQM